MKSIRFVALLFAAALLFFAVGAVIGSEAPAVEPVASASAAPEVVGAIEKAVHSAPEWVLLILAIVGALRIVVKPLVAAAHYVADQTASQADNQFVDRVERSRAFRAFVFVLDWITSIKIRPK
jgi:hypothetical protein